MTDWSYSDYVRRCGGRPKLTPLQLKEIQLFWSAVFVETVHSLMRGMKMLGIQDSGTRARCALTMVGAEGSL